MKKIHPFITNIVFYASMLMGLFTLYSIYMSRKGLPPGACPVDNHQEKIILTIILAVGYFIMTYFTADKSRKGS